MRDYHANTCEHRNSETCFVVVRGRRSTKTYRIEANASSDDCLRRCLKVMEQLIRNKDDEIFS